MKTPYVKASPSLHPTTSSVLLPSTPSTTVLGLQSLDSRPKQVVGRRKPAFTIVELLIVIVVIGILAAISIAAYAGISQSARDSSAKASAKQLATKLETTYVQDGAYPSALSDIGIRNTDTTSYQYTSSPTTNPPSWCSTVTVGSTSYYVSNTTATPTKGGCPGHGQGGVAAVVNLAKNPKPAGLPSLGYAGYAGVGGAVSMGLYSDAGLGRSVWRMTWTTGSTSNGGSFWVSDPIVVPGERYQISQTIRSSKNQTVFPRIVWVNSAGTAEVGPYVVMGTINLIAGVPQRIGASGIAPPGAGCMRIVAYSSYNKWEAGDTLDTWDTLMIKSDETTLYNYADGSSPNWVWNGTPNASTSTGPVL